MKCPKTAAWRPLAFGFILLCSTTSRAGGPFVPETPLLTDTLHTAPVHPEEPRLGVFNLPGCPCGLTVHSDSCLVYPQPGTSLQSPPFGSPGLDQDYLHACSVRDTSRHPQENQRLVGSGLALLLGPFGAHRIYLGTTPKVAVIYGLTFGGFGVLSLIDLGHLLFSKDLDQYRNNDRVIMWGRPKARITPP